MKLALVSLLCCLAMHGLLADETITLPATITIDGVTYSNVTWGAVTPATVTIYRKTGIARIPLEKLSPELQKKFGYHPQQAAEWTKAEQQRAMLAKWSKTLLTVPFKVGMVGVSRNGEITVLQVVGPNDMRAEVYTEELRSVYVRDSTASTYYSKISEPHEVWVKGISTEGLVDGVTITRKDVFKVTGTKTYETTFGVLRTIFVLEPLTFVSPP